MVYLRCLRDYVVSASILRTLIFLPPPVIMHPSPIVCPPPDFCFWNCLAIFWLCVASLTPTRSRAPSRRSLLSSSGIVQWLWEWGDSCLFAPSRRRPLFLPVRGVVDFLCGSPAKEKVGSRNRRRRFVYGPYHDALESSNELGSRSVLGGTRPPRISLCKD